MRGFFLALASCIFLGACSNHPLVDDMTWYKSSDVIHKVRCEAYEELLRHVDSQQVAIQRNEYDQINANLKSDQDQIKNDFKKDAEKYKNELEPLTAVRDAIKRKLELVWLQDEALQEKHLLFMHSVRRLLKDVEALHDDVKNTSGDNSTELTRLQLKIGQIQTELEQLETAKRRLEGRPNEISEEQGSLGDRLDALKKEIDESGFQIQRLPGDG